LKPRFKKESLTTYQTMACSTNATNSHIREVDMEDLAKRFQRAMNHVIDEPTTDDIRRYEHVIDAILKKEQDFTKYSVLNSMLKANKAIVKRSFLFQVFLALKHEKGCTSADERYIRNVLQIKTVKSHSGINSVTVFTSGTPEWNDPITGQHKKQEFSCAFNCSFCPTEPGQPKSYLSLEPGVLRANRNRFDCVSQMHDRMKALYLCGHECDKLEVLVLGGTWCSYPTAYREEFVRDIYYGANTFFDFFNNSMFKQNGHNVELRERKSLTEEKTINKHTMCKVIGLTLETRPDTITSKELKLLRYYGCTRVQLGIQHIDNAVLKKVNRQCTTERTIKAIKLLKDANFKLDAHFMPNLPGSSLELDTKMFQSLLAVVEQCEILRDDINNVLHMKYNMVNTDLQVDQWKVYPCTVVPWTDIEKWYKSGEYVPYDRILMKDMLLDMKADMLPWIRLNRIVRDITDVYSFDPEYRSNLRQDLASELKQQGKFCFCTRCREIKTQKFDTDNMFMVVREYSASEGKEYFISYESQDNKVLYGFIRLRLTTNQPIHIFPELEGCALIRELHVYGKLQPVSTKCSHVQHSGLGKHLVQKAEDIAKKNLYNKISVIAGEGTRGYYEKLGFIDDAGEGQFMMKEL
jgi:ELP3 family radical SAM enzyme/protein acetyltransferase